MKNNSLVQIQNKKLFITDKNTTHLYIQIHETN